MNKQYFKEYYYLERKHWWFLVRSKILQAIINKYAINKKKLQILNVGTATGATSQMLENFGEVTSIEYDQECCTFLNDHTGIKALNGSVLNLPFPDDHFNLVCCFDVIEHVDDDLKAVHELFRVVKKEGLVFITVPAFQFLWSHHDVINHHFRRYTMNSLDRILKEARKETLFKSYFNSLLFFPIAAYRLLRKIIPFRNKNGTGSDFQINNKFVDRLFYNIFNTEYHFLKSGFSFPFGVSILSLHKKK